MCPPAHPRLATWPAAGIRSWVRQTSGYLGFIQIYSHMQQLHHKIFPRTTERLPTPGHCFSKNSRMHQLCPKQTDQQVHGTDFDADALTTAFDYSLPLAPGPEMRHSVCPSRTRVTTPNHCSPVLSPCSRRFLEARRALRFRFSVPALLVPSCHGSGTQMLRKPRTMPEV